MSVDIISTPQDPGTRWPSGPIRDVVIIYGGWGSTDGDEELSLSQDTGSAQLARSVRSMSRPSGHHTRMLALQGDLVGSSSEIRGLSFIRQDFHPGAKIIIYGYSAGGVNALFLARRVQVAIPYYNITSRQLMFSHALTEDEVNQGVARVRIDLLVTVDAASGPTSDRLNRSVPACVRRNLNLYQTTASRQGSRGGPNSAVDSASTVIENIDLTGRTEHSLIDESVHQRVFEAIRGVLGRQLPPALGLELAQTTVRTRWQTPVRSHGWGRGRGIAPRGRSEIS